MPPLLLISTRTTVRAALTVALTACALMMWQADARAAAVFSKIPGTPVVESIGVGPPRKEFDNPPVAPGTTVKYKLNVDNRTKSTVDFTLSTSDIEGAEDPQSVLNIVPKSIFGAGEWITLDLMKFRLKPGWRLVQDVTVTVPEGTGGGSWYGAVVVTSKPVDTTEKSGASVQAISSLASELFVTVTGPQRIKGRITSVDSPVVATHKKSSLVPFEVNWKNTGNVTDKVGGKLQVRSIFGNNAFDAKFNSAVVLRGGTRQYRVVWRETPWIGIFHPTATFTGTNGKPVKASLPWMIVIPPWYYIVAVLLALIIPLFLWWRNRRRWNALYLEMYGDEDDDEFDDDWDEHVT